MYQLELTDVYSLIASNSNWGRRECVLRWHGAARDVSGGAGVLDVTANDVVIEVGFWNLLPGVYCHLWGQHNFLQQMFNWYCEYVSYCQHNNVLLHLSMRHSSKKKWWHHLQFGFLHN